MLATVEDDGARMSRKQSVTFLDHTTSAAVMQLEAQLREFYAGVAPDHMDYVSVVAAAYHDDVDALNEALTEKYGRSLPATPVAPYGPSAAGDDGRRVNGEIETQPAAVSHNMNGHTASGSASPQSASARMRHLSVLPNPELWAPPNGICVYARVGGSWCVEHARNACAGPSA